MARRAWLLCAFGDQAARAKAALARLQTGRAARAVPRFEWRAAVSREAHIARVRCVLDFIRAGDIYQANITVPFAATRSDNAGAADIFVALRAENPAPFSAFIGCGDGCAVASVSPERFLRLDAAGRIETRPIKGTRPRGATPADDAAEAAALVASWQGSRREFDDCRFAAQRYQPRRGAWQRDGAVAACTGEFCQCAPFGFGRGGASSAGLFRCRSAARAFPGGSITGAPKIRAMQIIADLEGAARGPYCGAAAWLGFDGAMDSSILIRTVTLAADRIVAQAGGGIVADTNRPRSGGIMVRCAHACERSVVMNVDG